MTTKLPWENAPRPRQKRRALLDTNIWRYVVDGAAQGSLLRVARDGAYDIQIAPAVVYETLRLKDTQLRSTLVRVMTNSRFDRLMPEAYSESIEILQEIKRIRPDWLRDVPDIQYFKRVKNDWSRKTGGFWIRCVRSPASEANFLSGVEQEMIDGAKSEAKLARQQVINSKWKRNPPMDKTFAGFDGPVSGWNGEMVEAWRCDRLVRFGYGLARHGNPYRDWIAPFVELDDGLLASAAWGSSGSFS